MAFEDKKMNQSEETVAKHHGGQDYEAQHVDAV